MPFGPLRLLLIADDPGAGARLFDHAQAEPAWQLTTVAASAAAAALADPAAWHAVVLEAQPDLAAQPTPICQLAAAIAGLPLIVLAETDADADTARQMGVPTSLVKSQIPPRYLATLIKQTAELRQAQLALAAGEARFRNIIERNADGILVTDLEGRVRFANPAAQALLGRPAAELHGAAFGYPIVSGETTEVDVLRRPGQPAVAEMRVVETQWDGQPACLASLRDITDRKLVESAEREQRGLAEALRDTAAALASTLDFEDVLDRILDNVGRVTSHDTAGIMLLEAPGLVRVVRSRGYGPFDTAAAPSSLRRVAEWAGLRQIAATHQPLAVPDTEAFPDWVTGSTTSWVHSYVGAPLRIKDEVIGFINLNSATPGYFTHAHAHRLQAFADQAAVAIENARLYDSRQRYADEIAALYRASGLLLGSPADLPGLANQIAHAIRQEFAISACNVYLIDEANRVLHCLAHQGRGGEPEASVSVHAPGLLGTAARTGESIYVPDVAHEPRYMPATALTRTQLVIPLRVSGRVLGVLDLQSDRLDALDQRAQRIVSAFAERAGLAFENARLFREAVRSAERRSLLYWATQAISASLDREQVCTAVHKAAAQIMTVDAILIALRTEDGQDMEDLYHLDRGRRLPSRRRPARLGLSGHVTATGETPAPLRWCRCGPSWRCRCAPATASWGCWPSTARRPTLTAPMTRCCWRCWRPTPRSSWKTRVCSPTRNGWPTSTRSPNSSTGATSSNSVSASLSARRATGRRSPS